MQDKLERLIKAVYRKWRSGNPKIEGAHPDEEMLACFLEGRLTPEENEGIKSHLISCNDCIVVDYMRHTYRQDILFAYRAEDSKQAHSVLLD